MDFDALAQHLNSWFENEHTITLVTVDGSKDALEQRERVNAEVVPLFAERLAADGLGPLDPITPPLSTPFKAKLKRRLRLRRLFKIERYTAPSVGGLMRVYASGVQKGDVDGVEVVLDVVVGPDGPLIVARHVPCHRCHGTASNDGLPCEHMNYGGERCVAGLIPRGGANIEVGARTDSARFETPKDWWIPLMER